MPRPPALLLERILEARAMKALDGAIHLAATDLSNHLGCRHLTALDLAAARGLRSAPTWRHPAVRLLQERGLRHEQAYLDHLESRGRTIRRIDAELERGAAAAATRDALRSGADVIVQATLQSGRWMGRADVLLRLERPSALGPWSYEVADTKLARETKGGTILQLCLYSDLLAEVQGLPPEWMHVVSPGRGFEPESFRLQDFLAYYRFIRRRLEESVEGHGPEDDLFSAPVTYPEPVPHCDVCRWWPECDRKRREDDHLSLVAGISRLQRRELEERDVLTLEGLGRHPLPFGWRPSRGHVDGYVRTREQARVQLEGRLTKEPVHELLNPEPERGLARLPRPSAGDLFLDLEGDPYVEGGGMEYLFGFTFREPAGGESYWRRWALDRAKERAGFEALVDEIMRRWAEDPDLHVYHFAPYEPSALKRLMGRHATREEEVDRMLRGGLFVDLHGVVRQGVRASVERYSIKDLERFYGFERVEPLENAAVARRAVEGALELGCPADAGAEARAIVERYNRDDCASASRLRGWLEELRAVLECRGEAVPRPAPQSPEPAEAIGERAASVAALMERLTAGVPADPAARDQGQRARWLLAQMLDWHRRENKASWWEYFRLRDLPDDELLDERGALAGLEFLERTGGTDKCPVHRYRFPSQETSLREGDELHSRDMRVGRVERIDLVAGLLDIGKSGKAAEVHPASVFESKIIRPAPLDAALFALGEWVADHGLERPQSWHAGLDLLLGRPPRIEGRAPGDLMDPGETPLLAARRLVMDLDGVLPLQGPPGSGKTFTGARMICDLVREGRKVGICAVSHKVIRNLLEAVREAAPKEGVAPRLAQKVGERSEQESEGIREVIGNEEALEALAETDVMGGTAWLWARDDFAGSVDVLFVDEAGQMSLANALAISRATRSLVLLGDPQQLEQPIQGSHPEGAEVSSLEHLLGGERTVAPDRGLFLAETWRLHPTVCAFTSEVFYEGRLRSHAGLERQGLRAGPCPEPGLYYLPVEHEGNQNSSAEEVDAVEGLVRALTAPDAWWTGADGRPRPLGFAEILIVAPYNAQVADLMRRLPEARIGTVDRFQGQEAAVVIYSMSSSSPEDAPRGMEFLYNAHRLNVATSRARCACVLVGSPRLFEPECRSPGQMRLASAFCRFLELARVAV